LFLFIFPEATGTPEAVVPIWAVIHSIHVALRYQAMKQLRFPFPNFKRGTALVHHFLSTHNSGSGSGDSGGGLEETNLILSLEEANREEKMLQGPEYGPDGLQCVLGCSIEELLNTKEAPFINTTHQNGSGGGGGGGTASDDLKCLLGLYKEERYVLTWRNRVAYVVLWENADAVDMLRALCQATWLNRAATIGNEERNNGGGSAAADDELNFQTLEESLQIMQRQFPQLQSAATAAGWELDRGVYPTGSFRLSSQGEN
jgi:hypothetical protein